MVVYNQAEDQAAPPLMVAGGQMGLSIRLNMVKSVARIVLQTQQVTYLGHRLG